MSNRKQSFYALKVIITIISAMMFTAVNVYALSGRIIVLNAETVNIVIDLISAIVVLAVMIFTLLDRSVNDEEVRKSAGIFFRVCAFSFFYIFFDGIRLYVDGATEFANTQYAVAVCVFAFGILDTMAASHYVIRLIKPATLFEKILFVFMLVFGLGCITAAVCSVNKGYLFRIEDGRYISGDYWIYFKSASLIIPSINIFILIFTKNLKTPAKLTAISYFLLPVAGIALQMTYPGFSFISVSIMLASLIFYSSLYIERNRDLAEIKRDLAESKLNAMILQIDSHFVYNTLGSIASLCRTDPALAEKMAYTFSDYLRSNVNDISQKSLIPFTEEMKNLESYITIETIRFPDITVKYNIECSDFFVPGMTLQPLVENAITHGIMGREQGGTLSICAFDNGDHYIIRVEDDGVGFSEMKKNDGKHHIGVANVRQRLETLCGGTLELNSIPGIGTVAEIKIPKEKIK